MRVYVGVSVYREGGGRYIIVGIYSESIVLLTGTGVHRVAVLNARWPLHQFSRTLSIFVPGLPAVILFGDSTTEFYS